MKKQGKLYLIPTGLGSGEPGKLTPVFNLDIINLLKVFVVENIKTTRRYLKKINPSFDIDQATFIEIGKNSEENNAQLFLRYISENMDVGLLSEAGLPCVADPGSEVVELAHMNNIEVIPLSGPSSIMLALMGSGLNGQNFVFHGYLPVKKNEREKMLVELEKTILLSGQTQIFIETPYRNNQLLESVFSVCSGKIKLCIACNLTLNDGFVITRNISSWKRIKPDLNKKPAVFLLNI